jgi:hypothetical protein
MSSTATYYLNFFFQLQLKILRSACCKITLMHKFSKNMAAILKIPTLIQARFETIKRPKYCAHAAIYYKLLSKQKSLYFFCSHLSLACSEQAEFKSLARRVRYKLFSGICTLKGQWLLNGFFTIQCSQGSIFFGLCRNFAEIGSILWHSPFSPKALNFILRNLL